MLKCPYLLPNGGRVKRRAMALFSSLTLIACANTAPYPKYNGVDLDCSDVGHQVTVSDGDPHKLDADGDGLGCEGW